MSEKYHKEWVTVYNRLIKFHPEILTAHAISSTISVADEWAPLLVNSTNFTREEIDSLFTFAYDARFWQNRLDDWPSMKKLRDIMLTV